MFPTKGACIIILPTLCITPVLPEDIKIQPVVIHWICPFVNTRIIVSYQGCLHYNIVRTTHQIGFVERYKNKQKPPERTCVNFLTCSLVNTKNKDCLCVARDVYLKICVPKWIQSNCSTNMYSDCTREICLHN